MFLPKSKFNQNPKREQINEFLGLNRTDQIKENEFSDSMNMASDAYPFLTTRKGREFIFSGSLDVAVSDNEYLESYSKRTGIRQNTSGQTEFFYRGNRIFTLDEVGYNQIVKFNNYFILFPKPYAISAIMSGDGQILSLEEDNFAYRIIGDTFNSSASIYYTDEWFKVSNRNGETTIGVHTGRVLLELKKEINSGSLKVGDRLKLEFVSGTEYQHTPLEGYDDSIMYVITNIAIDPYGGDKFGDYFDITCECFDATGARVVPNSIVINGVDLKDNLKHVIVSRTIDGKIGENYQERLFACDRIGGAIYFSSKSDFKNWDVSGEPSGGGKIPVADGGQWVGLKSFNGYLYAFKRNGLYRIMGNNALNYQINWMNDIGCTNQESICEYNSLLYYLNADGIYAFDGSKSVKISEKLNREYKRGVFGVYGGKIYCALEGFGESEREFFVYDISKKLWHKEDYLEVNSFVRYTDGLYAVTDTNGYKLAGEKQNVDFSVTTKKIYRNYSEKAVNDVCIYLQMEENTQLKVEIAYDNAEFEVCGQFSDARIKRIPVRLKKCKEFQLRLSGTGICKIMSVEFGLYQSKL